MTQMLLFDSPHVTEPVVAVDDSLARAAAVAPASEETNIAAQLEHEGGLHHMGDLARLVLLRYELVAKRRARLAARKAAK